ncbi:hypothetical protein C3L33_15403, partial [Rhododendron williamsianum]
MHVALLFHVLSLLGMCFSSLMVSCNLITMKERENPSPFPSDFLFGTASSAYQCPPCNIVDGTNGDVAVDHYHRYLSEFGPQKSRSIFKSAWGRFGKVNMAGIRHYNKLIDSLLHKGLASTPHLTVQKPSTKNIHVTKLVSFLLHLQKTQGGSVGIVMNAIWFEPITSSLEDKLAAERAQSFYMNWFLDPIILGKYPEEMHKILGSILPNFSEKDLEKMKRGLDFIGINHYTSFYIKDCLFSVCERGPGNSRTEGLILRTALKDGNLIGESVRFGEMNNPNTTIEVSLNDVKRVQYMNGYLDALARAIRKGAYVRGYFTWSLLDNFEWISGYTIRFGLHHVDYTTLKRTPKLSATWYKQYISEHKARSTLMSRNIASKLVMIFQQKRRQNANYHSLLS